MDRDADRAGDAVPRHGLDPRSHRRRDRERHEEQRDQQLQLPERERQDDDGNDGERCQKRPAQHCAITHLPLVPIQPVSDTAPAVSDTAFAFELQERCQTPSSPEASLECRRGVRHLDTWPMLARWLKARGRCSSPARPAGSVGAIAERLERDGWSVHGVDIADADLTTREGNRAVVDAALERFGPARRDRPERRLPARRAGRGVPGGAVGQAARGPAHEPVPAREVRLGGAGRERRRAHLRDRLGSRARRLAVQGRVRVGKARRRRAREDARARRGAAGDPGDGGLPGVRADAARRGADRRPGRRARPAARPRARGRDPRPARRQAADRARGGRRRRSRSCSARADAPSPARPSRWRSAGPPARAGSGGRARPRRPAWRRPRIRPSP